MMKVNEQFCMSHRTTASSSHPPFMKFTNSFAEVGRKIALETIDKFDKLDEKLFAEGTEVRSSDSDHLEEELALQNDNFDEFRRDSFAEDPFGGRRYSDSNEDNGREILQWSSAFPYFRLTGTSIRIPNTENSNTQTQETYDLNITQNFADLPTFSCKENSHYLDDISFDGSQQHEIVDSLLVTGKKISINVQPAEKDEEIFAIDGILEEPLAVDRRSSCDSGSEGISPGSVMKKEVPDCNLICAYLPALICLYCR